MINEGSSGSVLIVVFIRNTHARYSKKGVKFKMDDFVWFSKLSLYVSEGTKSGGNVGTANTSFVTPSICFVK